jgi:hypothetical protein
MALSAANGPILIKPRYFKIGEKKENTLFFFLFSTATAGIIIGNKSDRGATLGRLSRMD